MCGIIGIVGEKKNLYDLKTESMLYSLRKRGPDDKGVISFPVCTLGQTRLSILDLSGGHQPMKDNTKNIAITFNGEIYNYKELKKNLEEKGHRFSTRSDTEVILKTYIEYGAECIKYLEGMFAFAIWDEDKKNLFAARDRFGEKPFYYSFDNNNNFVFASEIKTLFASGEIRGKINFAAIDSYLSLMYIPPNKTVYQNIDTLPPACLLVLKEGRLEVKKYWELKKDTIDISYIEAKECIKNLLERSVKKMMVADVEAGTFLSGGVDSTLITYFAQKNSSFPIKTFSVGYEHYINELPYAEEASKRIGTDHYTLQAKGNMFEELNGVFNYLDEPHADSSILAQSLISNLASSKVKVALTGDGADELFFGYGWYTNQWNLSWKKDFFEKLWPRPFKKYLESTQVFNLAERKKMWKNKYFEYDYVPHNIRLADIDPTDKINLYDLTFYLPGQLLSKIDRIAMMNSLETRCPFLDRELAEFVYNLPLEFKVSKNSWKIILKDVLSDIMPKEFVYRRKQGFCAPIKKWLEEPAFKKDITEIFIKNNPFIYSFFDDVLIKKLILDFFKNNSSNYYKIWVLYCLELWFKNHEKYHA